SDATLYLTKAYYTIIHSFIRNIYLSDSDLNKLIMLNILVNEISNKIKNNAEKKRKNIEFKLSCLEDIKQLNNSIKSLKKENEILNEKLNICIKEKSKYEIIYQDNLIDIKNTEKHIKAHQNEIIKYEKEIKTLKIMINKQDTQLLENNSRKDIVNENIEVIKTTSNELINQNVKCKNELIEIVNSIEAEQKKQNNLKQKLDKMNKANSETKFKYDEKVTELNNVNSKKQEFTIEIEKLNKSRKNYLEDLNKKKNVIYENQNELNKKKKVKYEVEKKARPIVDKLSSLQINTIKNKSDVKKLETINETNKVQQAELEKEISAMNNIILNHTKQISKYTSLTELENQQETYSKVLVEKQKQYNNIANDNKTISESIRLNENIIAEHNKVKINEQTLHKQKIDQQKAIKLKVDEFAKLKVEIQLSSEKMNEIENKIIISQKMIANIDEYKNNSIFWSQFYNEIIVTETAYHHNSIKIKDNKKQIKDLENTVGEQVYLDKVNEIRRTRSYLNMILAQYRDESRKYWFVSKLLDNSINSSTNSINSHIESLIKQTADELLPYIYNYENYELDNEKKLKIITEALRMYPEYLKLSDTKILSGNLDRINNSWRIKILKICEKDENFNMLDMLEPKMLITPIK
ncbi:MAG: hypothetical protein K8S87_11140, partial [Planctomycetes bacterium]|nr:hypothetical protein [Planctomycetota bacterium]